MNIPFIAKRSKIQEHFDWLIVRHASDHGDDDATLAMALCRIINHGIEEMQAELSRYRNEPDGAISNKQRADHCQLLENRIKNLKKQRRALVYKGYRLQNKRAKIYYQSTGEPKPSKFNLPWKKEKR